MPDEPSASGYDLQTQVALLRAEVRTVSANQNTTNAKVDALDNKVDGRPSWIATSLLSVSTMANGALLAALVAALHK